ncbi:hypothetical protein SAMN05444266_10699 [Chitinophaga jiangningensis]|uniref:LTXXQ motif family protein n=1 Tax=Chitinophaga jiangningensis TaxID=1419482 RepID=A0A1M7FE82_9BACT|nr:hypothetical protein [Chitinophaga jiangningensis]SHM02098.1 hypothetical protein SAMN05444266_10699 [Chitinophaga jiangningensis]
MKKLTAYAILLLSSWAFSLTAAHSQEKDSSAARGRWTPEAVADKMTDKISRELKLSKAQTKEIYAINLDIEKKSENIKLSKKNNAKSMSELNALNNERNQRFKTVLTAPQYKKWTDWTLNKQDHLEAKIEKKKQKKEGQPQ